MRHRFDGFQVRAADDPPSLLAVVIDASVPAWIQAVASTTSSPADAAAQAASVLLSTVEQLFVFLNTFLLLHDANRVIVLVTTPLTAEIVYPVIPNVDRLSNDYDDTVEDNALEAAPTGGLPPDPSVVMTTLRNTVVQAVKRHIDAQCVRDGESQHPATPLISTALALALCLLNRARVLRASRLAATLGDIPPPSASGAALAADSSFGPDGGEADVPANGRILAVVAAADNPTHYVPTMNAIFSAQRLQVPIDSCVISHVDSTYLQQAAHLTQGVCIRLPPPSPDGGESQALLQTLQTVFLVDRQGREMIAMPAPKSVDFRASCMQTRKIIDDGYTCSVCLSTFATTVAKGAAMCPVCNARFAVLSRSKRRPPPRP